MTMHFNIFRKKTKPHPQTLGLAESVRYWACWAIVLLLLTFALNQYFDYRNRELEKKLELLK